MDYPDDRLHVATCLHAGQSKLASSSAEDCNAYSSGFCNFIAQDFKDNWFVQQPWVNISDTEHHDENDKGDSLLPWGFSCNPTAVSESIVRFGPSDVSDTGAFEPESARGNKAYYIDFGNREYGISALV